MRESAVEKHLIKRVEALSGLAMKFVSPGFVAVPDRLVLLPGGRVIAQDLRRDRDGVMFFVEVKRPGETPTTTQQRRHEQLRALGATVYAADTIDAVDLIMENYQ